jgi:predicted nucleotidyltransferase component of viral defense system
MIGRGEITKQAQRDRVDAQTVERDYILAHAAIEIAAGAGEQMVLKGGTSLRLAHFANYRYSADLDYSLIGITEPDALEIIGAALARCRDRIGADSVVLDTGASPPRIGYVGPLAAKPRTIKLDLADDELVLEHTVAPVVVAWRDLPESASIRCYTLTEICAEKLRCVIQRRQCRDIYDLWNLLEKRGGADLFEAWHRFERKAEHKGLEPHRFFDRWESGLDWYRARWTDELADYVGNDCPDFNAVSRALNQQVARVREYIGE